MISDLLDGPLGRISDSLLHSAELLSWPLVVMLGVSGLTLERERVEWVLRMLLVEDVLLAVVPVWVAGHVTRSLLDWLWNILQLLVLWQIVDGSLLSESDLVRRGQVHSVGVDNLGLLLQVECLLVTLDLSISQLAIVILTVV